MGARFRQLRPRAPGCAPMISGMETNPLIMISPAIAWWLITP
jgi:hypothetical protein